MYEDLHEFMDRLLLEGQPFEIYLTLSTTTAGTFTLDSTAWDWNGDGTAETAPFSNKMLVITGMSYEATIGDTSVTLDYLTIDGVECTPLDWYEHQSVATEEIKWDGMVKEDADDFHWPSIADHFGVPLVCRQAISAKLSEVGGQGDSLTLRFRGYAIDRQY